MINITLERFLNQTDDPLYYDTETWTLFPDNRHNVDGYRCMRYIQSNFDDAVWDGQYMFFNSVDEAVTTMKSGDLTEARKRF